MVKIGQVVVFVDERGKPNSALITKVFGGMSVSLNLTIINPDGKMNDQYGRQIIRKCSVVHRSEQTANGNYWHKFSEVTG